MTDTIETQDETTEYEELAGETVEEPSVPFAHVHSTGAAMVEAVIGMLRTELNASKWMVTGLIRAQDDADGDTAVSPAYGLDLDDLLSYTASLSRTIEDLRSFYTILPSVIAEEERHRQEAAESINAMVAGLQRDLEAAGITMSVYGSGVRS